MNRARYIVVVGPDGSGKTTVADRLAEVLAENYSVRRMELLLRNHAIRVACAWPCSAESRPEGCATPVWSNLAKCQIFLGIWYGIDHVLGRIPCTARNRVK